MERNEMLDSMTNEDREEASKQKATQQLDCV